MGAIAVKSSAAAIELGKRKTYLMFYKDNFLI